MNKKGRQVFQEKIEGWHPQLPPRVSPTLVTPLHLASYFQLELKSTCEHITAEQCFNGLLLLVCFKMQHIYPAEQQFLRVLQITLAVWPMLRLTRSYRRRSRLFNWKPVHDFLLVNTSVLSRNVQVLSISFRQGVGSLSLSLIHSVSVFIYYYYYFFNPGRMSVDVKH